MEGNRLTQKKKIAIIFIIASTSIYHYADFEAL